MNPFDFSNFVADEAKRPIEFIGLSTDQTAQLLNDQFGISRTLMQKYQDVTCRGTIPNSTLKCLIVFENNGRDTTYEEISQSCNINIDTAVEHMRKARKWVSEALKLKIEHSGERVYLVSNESLATKADRLDGHIQKMNRALSGLISDVDSIRQSGQEPVLPGKAAALITGYQQVKALEAVN